MINKNNRGITLFETLISTITFGIIMILMFNMSSSFFKVFTNISSKQDMNSKFMIAYNQMQKELLVTDAKYAYTFRNDFTHMKSRWLFFPSPTDTHSVIKGEGKHFNWQRLIIYYLVCTNPSCPECPTKQNTTYEQYKYCSDKQLIRLIYNYVASNDPYIFSIATSELIDDISSYLLPYSSTEFPNPANYKINDEACDIAILAEKRIIAKDLLDMDIQENMDSITIKLSSVRKDEIKKEVNYGETDFTKEPALRFVDQIEFTVITKNS